MLGQFFFFNVIRIQELPLILLVFNKILWQNATHLSDQICSCIKLIAHITMQLISPNPTIPIFPVISYNQKPCFLIRILPITFSFSCPQCDDGNIAFNLCYEHGAKLKTAFYSLTKMSASISKWSFLQLAGVAVRVSRQGTGLGVEAIQGSISHLGATAPDSHGSPELWVAKCTLLMAKWGLGLYGYRPTRIQAGADKGLRGYRPAQIQACWLS